MACFSPCILDGTWRGFTHEVLELCEDLFDWIKIGAVGGQKDEMRPDLSDGCPYGFALVGAEIVEDDNIALGKRWNKHLLDIGGEDVAVDRPIDHPRGVDAVMAQRGDECQRFPMPMWHTGFKPLAARAPTSQGCHVGFDPCLIEENETFWINPVLIGLPTGSFASDIRT